MYRQSLWKIYQRLTKKSPDIRQKINQGFPLTTGNIMPTFKKNNNEY